jgi:hypothetical protein
MKKKSEKPITLTTKTEFPEGYPLYPPGEDIYENMTKELFEEDLLPGKRKPVSDPTLENDLDVPGSELDDANEMIGEEDEENNYYSIGGDDHNNLDEDKSELPG